MSQSLPQPPRKVLSCEGTPAASRAWKKSMPLETMAVSLVALALYATDRVDNRRGLPADVVPPCAEEAGERDPGHPGHGAGDLSIDLTRARKIGPRFGVAAPVLIGAQKVVPLEEQGLVVGPLPHEELVVDAVRR